MSSFCPHRLEGWWVVVELQIEKREQTESGLVKASCLAKQTAIITICTTVPKEKKSFYRFINLICRQTTAIIWQLWLCICFVNMGRRRWVCFWVDRNGKHRREKTVTGRGREVKLTSLLSEMESCIVCLEHQSRLFSTICFYWPFILEFDNTTPSLPYPSFLFLYFSSSLTDGIMRWRRQQHAASCSRRDIIADGWDPPCETRVETLFAKLILFPHKFPSGRENICLYRTSAAPLVICWCLRLTMTSKLKAR